MNQETIFHPPRLAGTIVNMVGMTLFVGASVGGLWQATQAGVGINFLLALLPTLVAVVAVPLLAYRLYGLRGSFYALERDGLRLRWGLRWEDIPMTAIAWVRPAAELEGRLPLPMFRWPGAVVGKRLLGGLPVEFLAASTRDLVLVGTDTRIFAISPADPQAFLKAYRRLTELGSLAPIPARSTLPQLLINRVWETPPARTILLTGLALTLLLTIWVSLAIPGRQQISLGFQPTGALRDPVPSVHLLLLPFLNGVIYLADLFLGLFFYRRDDSRPLAYLLWAGGLLTPVFFLLGVFFILSVS